MPFLYEGYLILSYINPGWLAALTGYPASHLRFLTTLYERESGCVFSSLGRLYQRPYTAALHWGLSVHDGSIRSGIEYQWPSHVLADM